MKKLTLFLFTVLCISFLYAQTNVTDNRDPDKPKFTNEEFFQQSELVVEAQPLGGVANYYANGSNSKDDIYSILAYKVQRVYKGEAIPAGDTIYLAVKGKYNIEAPYTFRQIDSNNFEIIENLPGLSVITDFGNGIEIGINEYTPLVLFLVASDFPHDYNSKYSSYKKYKYLVKKNYSKGISSDELYVGNDGNIAGLNNLAFHTREEFYNYMKQFEGFIVPETKSKSLEQIEKIEENEPLKDATHVNQEYNETFKNPFSQEFIPEKVKSDKKKARKKAKRSRDYNTITFQIENHQLIYDEDEDKHYVLFDIMVSSNNFDIFFSQAFLRLRYNTPIIGANATLNGKITFNFGDSFTNGYSCSNGIVGWDNIFIFYMGVKNPPDGPNRITLSHLPTLFGSFKIELLPNLASGQSFFYFDPDPTFTSYTNFALSGNADIYEMYYYDDIFYLNSDTIPIATNYKPFITTNLDDISKVAGIGDTLTISGYHFGTEPGQVLFKAADKGGTDYLKDLDDQYIVDWSNTQIKAIVPSRVYKGYEPSSTGGAGSGLIKIKTNAGDSCISANALQIPYSITNAKETNGSIRRVYLAKKHCDYDFQFTLHSAYEHDSLKIATIDTALRHWSALSGLTLQLERDLQGNLVFDSLLNDNKNFIHPDTTRLMGARRKFSGVIINNDTIFYRTTGSHISINNHLSLNRTWNYALSGNTGVNELSFYQAFMHELGHILLLGHINQQGELMYYGISPSSPIITINSSSIPVQAVKQTIADSRAIPWPSSFVQTPQISIVNPALCYGDPVILSSNYTNGNLWSTGATTQTITVNSAGTYWLTNTSGTCSLTDTVSITQPDPLAVSINLVKAIDPPYGTSFRAIVTGGTPPYTYNWSYISLLGNRVPCNLAEYYNSSTIPTHCQTASCQLKLTVTDSNGCQEESYTSKAQDIFASIENLESAEIVLIPNPTSGSFTISNINNATIYLYSSLGSHIQTFEHVSSQENININHLLMASIL